MSAAAFAAIADPTRRTIIERMATQQSITATELAEHLDISRQAVAKHLSLIAAAGIATSERVGRETRFSAQPEPLEAITAWVSTVESAWGDRLGRLASSIGAELKS